MHIKLVFVWFNYYLIIVYGQIEPDIMQCPYMWCGNDYACLYTNNKQCPRGMKICLASYSEPHTQYDYGCLQDKSPREDNSCGPGAVYNGYKDVCTCKAPAVANYDVSCNTNENCAHVNCRHGAVCQQSAKGGTSCHCQRNVDLIEAFQCEVMLATGNSKTPEQDVSKTLAMQNAHYHYIHVYIYQYNRILTHFTDSILQEDKNFTITLQFSQDLIIIHDLISNIIHASLLKLICYKQNKRTEIYINQEIPKDNQNFRAYVTIPLKKTDFWKCEIHSGTNQYSPLTFVFRANYEFTRQSTPQYTISTPSISTPSINTPSINTPSISTTSISTPSINTPSISSPSISTTSISTTSISTTPISTTTPASDTNQNVEHNTVIIVVIVVALFLLVMLATWLIISLNKRSQRRKSAQASSNINYEPWPEHRESPLPLPPQWNTSALTHPHEENLYSAPYPEELYANPLPKAHRPRPPVVSPYAEILNKGGKSNILSTYDRQKSPMPPYSEIKHGPSRVQQPSQKPETVVYTNVVPKNQQNSTEEKYSNSDFKSYTNEHGTVNATPEYIEPAYCEL